jgi:hypothetical protein
MDAERGGSRRRPYPLLRPRSIGNERFDGLRERVGLVRWPAQRASGVLPAGVRDRGTGAEGSLSLRRLGETGSFATPGKSIAYQYVAQYLVAIFRTKDVRKVAFDRWNMKHLRPWLIREGLTESLIDDRFVEFGQGYQSMTPALRTLESLLLDSKLMHGNNPVLRMCAANAVVKD